MCAASCAGACASGRRSSLSRRRPAEASSGSSGTAFTRILLDRGHDVILACRSRGHAEAIAQTGRNPHYLQGVDLSSVEPVALADAPGDAEVVVAAVPSKAFAGVVSTLPGAAPVLSLAKGLD